MGTGTRIRVWLAGAAMASGVIVMAAQLTVTLPPDTASYRQSDLPGYALVQRNCLLCHSAEYVLTQPPTLPRAYWDATVKKMKTPFGAPFPDDEIPAMVDYLARTYGAK